MECEDSLAALLAAGQDAGIICQVNRHFEIRTWAYELKILNSCMIRSSRRQARAEGNCTANGCLEPSCPMKVIRLKQKELPRQSSNVGENRAILIKSEEESLC